MSKLMSKCDAVSDCIMPYVVSLLKKYSYFSTKHKRFFVFVLFFFKFYSILFPHKSSISVAYFKSNVKYTAAPYVLRNVNTLFLLYGNELSTSAIRHGCNVKNGLKNIGWSICVKMPAILNCGRFDKRMSISLNIFQASSNVSSEPSGKIDFF